MVFIGYWFSLADNVGLGFSGIYSVGANYMGVSHPPGYPVWTVYGWLFTKLLPFSNIAWRLAISSAVAGALTCGLIALMVSRSSRTLLAGINGLQKLSPQNDHWLRVVAGCVAGMTFGFDGAFWRKAVIVDVWPLSVLLFATTLCLLLRWAHEPERKSYFVAACFVFGLTITNSQALIPAGLGLYFYVVLVDKRIGRDASIAASVLLTLWWLGNFVDFLPGFVPATREIAPPETRLILKLITASTVCLFITLSIKTRRWVPSMTACWASLAFAGGTAFYFLIPVFSATNPPVNWGYPRNLEGFMHVLNRGQYEITRPVSDCAIYLGQLLGFARSVFENFGLFPTLTALIPLGFFFRLHMEFRLHILRLLVLLLSFSALLVALLNPLPNRFGTELVAAYYTPPHLLIAILMGYGLVLLGTIISRTQHE